MQGAQVQSLVRDDPACRMVWPQKKKKRINSELSSCGMHTHHMGAGMRTEIMAVTTTAVYEALATC